MQRALAVNTVCRVCGDSREEPLSEAKIAMPPRRQWVCQMRKQLWVVVTALLLSQSASAEEADWRIYGFTDSDTYLLLYSVPDVVRGPDSVRVWTQQVTVSKKSVEELAKDARLMATVKGRTAASYVPPLAALEKMPNDQIGPLIALEEMTNERRFPTQSMMLTEIDCKNARMRFLQLTMYTKDGKPGVTNTVPSDWEYAQPQTNGKRLVSLICNPRLTAPANAPTSTPKS